MGVFHVEVEIGDPEGRRYERVDTLVDTRSTYTSLPRPLLEALGVQPRERAWFTRPDGRRVERELGHAWVRVGEKTAITIVIFADPGGAAVLGAYALEGLRLAPDPFGRRLVPVPVLYMPLSPVPA